jgi:hypothetical protein
MKDDRDAAAGMERARKLAQAVLRVPKSEVTKKAAHPVKARRRKAS